MDPFASRLDSEILEARNITTLPITLADFVEEASTVLAPELVDPARLDQLQGQIPVPLTSYFEVNPAPVVRFLKSWTYVNDAPFNETPNVRAFLRGDKANWGLIGSQGRI